ncbi:MAG: two-component regulator propeller domain-containing protein [Calditrichia bacterium]
MKSMKTTILLLTVKLLILCCLPGYSQHQKFRFSHLTTDHGLSQSNITSILQDDKGFLWFGTFNGLNKYNGYEFEIFNYQFKDTTSISHNYISSLFQDKNGYLWVGTSDGLNQSDYETNRYKSYKNEANDPGSIADNQIETILEDSVGGCGSAPEMADSIYSIRKMSHLSIIFMIKIIREASAATELRSCLRTATGIYGSLTWMAASIF